MNGLRYKKLFTAATQPVYWRALSRCVLPAVEHHQALGCIVFKSLIDAGANKGQFAAAARGLNPALVVRAFEPLPGPRAQFASVLQGDTIVYPFALGLAPARLNFFVTSRADSSSLLRPGSGQKAAYDVDLDHEETVEVVRLDEVLDVAALPGPVLFKLDVQGAELDALRGSEGVLSQIAHVYLEGSFVELYEGQPLVSEIMPFLKEKGFGLRGVFNQSITEKFGPTQADFLFSRERQRSS
jgi:FkbM family methyltransferase